MRLPPDGPILRRAEDADIDTELHRPKTAGGPGGPRRDEMSASTRTISQPAGSGSIFMAIALGLVGLLAVGAIAWGVMNLTASKHVATPVAAPLYLDKGSRADVAKPVAPFVESKPGNVTPRFDTNSAPTGAGSAAQSTSRTQILDRNADNGDNGDVVTHGRFIRPS
jgi:hypothetical protein